MADIRPGAIVLSSSNGFGSSSRDPQLIEHQVSEGLGGIIGGIVGAVGGLVTGGPGGAVAGAKAGYSVGESLTGGGSEPAQGSPTVPGNVGGPAGFTGGGGFGGCPPGTIAVGERCLDFFPGGATQGQGVNVDPIATGPGGNGGPLAMNGSTPQVTTQTTRRCGRGMVLGYDGRCYDRRTISNKQRYWPKGRKPLLTGGELNAISKAARAARRVEGTKKKLEKLGLLKKPSRGRSRSSGAHSNKGSGKPEILVVNTE